ncbi:MAG: hypothetical protein ACLFVP_00045 [Candidatus Bathyarchaeia archaeon]
MTGLQGPILTGFISGLLTALIRSHLGWMTFSFALLYGVLVGVLYRLFGVIKAGEIRVGRLLASSLISTLVVGAMSAITTMVLRLMPYSLKLVALMMVAGSLQGVAGGFLSIKIYINYVRDVFPTMSK